MPRTTHTVQHVVFHFQPAAVVSTLDVNEEWLRHITPALTRSQMQDAVGMTLPDDVLSFLGHSYSYQDAQPPESSERPPLESIQGVVSEKRYSRGAAWQRAHSAYAQTECPICLAAFRSNSKVGTILKCKHLFHHKCIKRWLTQGRASCPVCKAQLSAK